MNNYACGRDDCWAAAHCLRHGVKCWERQYEPQHKVYRRRPLAYVSTATLERELAYRALGQSGLITKD